MYFIDKKLKMKIFLMDGFTQKIKSNNDQG